MNDIEMFLPHLRSVSAFLFLVISILFLMNSHIFWLKACLIPDVALTHEHKNQRTNETTN